MAGCHGSGKSHIFRELKTMPPTASLDWSTFTYVDPDEIRATVPELKTYLGENPWTAGEKTHMETSYLSEIIQRKLLSVRRNLVVDGSLHDHEWFSMVYLPWIRTNFPEYKIYIVHVQAK